MRAAMIRTAYSDANLSPLPDDCTYTLTIEMRDDNIRPGKVRPPPRIPSMSSADGRTQHHHGFRPRNNHSRDREISRWEAIQFLFGALTSDLSGLKCGLKSHEQKENSRRRAINNPEMYKVFGIYLGVGAQQTEDFRAGVSIAVGELILRLRL